MSSRGSHGSRHRAWLLAVGLLLGACAPRTVIVGSEGTPTGAEDARRILTAVRSDLEVLLRAQESHRAESGRYSYDLAELGFTPSPGVAVDVLEADAGGFSALATADRGRLECVVFAGTADPPRAYSRTTGVVACRP